MRLALTGTPGTGKTAVARQLARSGIPVLDLAALAEDCGAVVGLDRARSTRIVDEEVLADAFRTAANVLAGEGTPVVAEGHYAHDMPVDAIAVLRTRPDRLLTRLLSRGWVEGKLRENVEAEVLGIICAEALATGRPTFEIDTSRSGPAAVAAIVRRALRRRPAGSRPDPGRWPLDSLPWV